MLDIYPTQQSSLSLSNISLNHNANLKVLVSFAMQPAFFIDPHGGLSKTTEHAQGYVQGHLTCMIEEIVKYHHICLEILQCYLP